MALPLSRTRFLESLEQIPCGPSLQGDCPICIQSFAGMTGKVAVRVPCQGRHVFCQLCLENYAAQSNRNEALEPYFRERFGERVCPYCREPLWVDRNTTVSDWEAVMRTLENTKDLKVLVERHWDRGLFGLSYFLEMHRPGDVDTEKARTHFFQGMLNHFRHDRGFAAAPARAAWFCLLEKSYTVSKDRRTWPRLVTVRYLDLWPERLSPQAESEAFGGQPADQRYQCYRLHEYMIMAWLQAREGHTMSPRALYREFTHAVTHLVTAQHANPRIRNEFTWDRKEETDRLLNIVNAICTRLLRLQMDDDKKARQQKEAQEEERLRKDEEDGIMRSAKEAAVYAESVPDDSKRQKTRGPWGRIRSSSRASSIVEGEGESSRPNLPHETNQVDRAQLVRDAANAREQEEREERITQLNGRLGALTRELNEQRTPEEVIRHSQFDEIERIEFSIRQLEDQKRDLGK